MVPTDRRHREGEQLRWTAETKKELPKFPISCAEVQPSTSDALEVTDKPLMVVADRKNKSPPYSPTIA